MAHLKYTEYRPPEEQEKGAARKRLERDDRIRDDRTLGRSHPAAAAVPHRQPLRG